MGDIALHIKITANKVKKEEKKEKRSNTNIWESAETTEFVPVSARMVPNLDLHSS